MRKKYTKSIILTFVLLLILAAFILKGEVVGVFKGVILDNVNIFLNNKNISNKYEMDLNLDDENRILTGTEKVTYFNRSNKTMDEIYFHLYPNAFNNADAVPVMFNDQDYAYPTGFNPCYIEILNITADGKKISYSINGIDSTTLKLELKKPVRKNEYVQLQINFQLKIPEGRDRIGYYNGLYLFGNWYPIAAVYDKSGWNLDPFYNIGDPFYSDSADYEVKITIPEKYIVASTGYIFKETIEKGKRIISIDAKSVRDFAWAASDKFQTYDRELEGINIKCYFVNSNSERINKAISTVEKTISVFNEKFGKYPYTSYSIVETYFPSGMEYPGLSIIPDSYFDGSKTMLGLEGVIVHETAHQWWYGVVGNNEIDEAWLDEGLATYAKVIYFEAKDGKSFGRDYYEKNIKSIYESKSKSIKGREILLKPVNEFDGWREYDTLAYKKSAVLFETLRNKTGDEKFFEILRSFYDEYKFKNATTQDFINIVEKVTDSKWSDFFDQWLMDK